MTAAPVACRAADKENAMQTDRAATAALILVTTLAGAPASARPHTPFRDPPGSFTATFSNIAPLAFGMTAADAARALQVPLAYVRGRPGDEIYLAINTAGGSGFFKRRNELYLQFRRGRLTGWKGDWGGSDWLWQLPPL
jgi:hypothetical protein